MRKITLSLPQNLVEFADRMARATARSRSQVISQALVAAQRQSERRLAEAGYRFYAQESSEFAQASAMAVAEATAVLPAATMAAKLCAEC